MILLAAAAWVAATGWADGAVVEVTEEVGSESSADLTFSPAAGETSHLIATRRDADPEHFEIELRDASAPVFAGSGCRGGGPPGEIAVCTLHKPHPKEYHCEAKICNFIPNVAWRTTLTFVLGQGGPGSLDATALGDLDVTVVGGPSDDLIATSDGLDTIDPGRGRDHVSSGPGRDRVIATAAPDGPDFYDLGSGGDTSLYPFEQPYDGDSVDYRSREAATLYTADELADDGAAGERDTVVNAEVIRSGSGDDTLVGDAGTNSLLGGRGADRIYGLAGGDALFGQTGSDLLKGGNGFDELTDLKPGGGDRAFGGPGGDYIELGAGQDLGDGGGGSDAIITGKGRDLIRAMDGERDDVHCGADADRAVLDRVDRLHDCDRIIEPASEHLESPARERLWRNW